MQRAAAPPYQDAPPITAAVAAERPFGRIKLAILVSIFLQRIALNLGVGGRVLNFPVSIFTMPLLMIWNVLSGVAVVPMQRVIPFLIFFTVVLMSTIYNNGGDSITSLLLLAGIYATFITPIELSEPAYKRYFRIIADVASFICYLGTATYLLQYVIHAQWLFSWRGIVPPQFLVEFNTLNMVHYPEQIYKADGFFLMEPSYQSQLAARALLLSIFILKDLRYLIPLGLGLLSAYSGTGIVLFLIFGAVPLIYALMQNPRLRMLLPIGLLLLPIAVLALWSHLNLGLFIERLNEFSNPRSSAYARFVNSQIMFARFGASDFMTLAFGAGPGTSAAFGESIKAVGEASQSTWIKLFIEYGILGFVAFLGFFYTCTLHTLRSHWLATAFTFHFFFLDSGFNVPQQAFMTLLLGAYVCLKPGSADSKAAEPSGNPRPDFNGRSFPAPAGHRPPGG
jgi:hypothetical protein